MLELLERGLTDPDRPQASPAPLGDRACGFGLVKNADTNMLPKGTKNTMTASPRKIRCTNRVWIHLHAVLSMAMFLGCGSQEPPELDRPNIVLIVVDTLRASNVSFMGYSRPTTPHLDELAATSFVFDQAISVGGNTTTAMAAMMTGYLSHFEPGEDWALNSFGMSRFYAHEGESGLPSTLRPLAERLRDAGYSTAGFITNPFLKKVFNFHRGFDRYEEIFRDQGIPYGQGESVANLATQFLSSAPRHPFFLYLHFMDAHGPYAPPEPYRSQFASTESPSLEDPQGDLWKTWEHGISELDRKTAIALSDQMEVIYDGAIRYVDNCIGEVLRQIEDSGLKNETIIVVTSDHGEEFLEHGGTTHKGSLYEELVRVPLIIHLPGSDSVHVEGLVRNFDIMPTLLDLAGVDDRLDQLDAVSLAPFLRSGGRLPRLSTYAAFPWIRMIRTTRHKLLLRQSGEVELYDLETDFEERRNLQKHDATGSSTIVEALRASLAAQEDRFFVQNLGERKSPISVDPTTQEQLRSLGYTN